MHDEVQNKTHGELQQTLHLLSDARSNIASLETTVTRRDRLTEHFVMHYAIGPIKVRFIIGSETLLLDDIAQVLRSMASQNDASCIDRFQSLHLLKSHCSDALSAVLDAYRFARLGRRCDAQNLASTDRKTTFGNVNAEIAT
jgi:hypothetical protein